MAIVIEIARWRLEVEPAETRERVEQLPLGAGCDCAYCRNVAALPATIFPEPFRTLADSLGIDLRKPAELTHWCQEPSGLHLTGGWYHVIGRIVEGHDLVVRTGTSGTYEFEELVPGFHYGFDSTAYLVPDVFSEHPVVQLEFMTSVPWVLSEPEPMSTQDAGDPAVAPDDGARRGALRWLRSLRRG